jgi:phospholipase C
MDLPNELQGRTLSRRQLLRYFGMLGAGAMVSNSAAAWAAGPSAARLVGRAASTRAAGSDLGAIDHIVFLMMENRSYDHYFGAYPRGRGFDDHPAHSLGVFAQDYPGATDLIPPNVLLPFHLDSTQGMECTDDLTHDWGPMHLCWNDGQIDSWVKVHTSSTYEGAHGAMTMGYYEREDLPFYYALADAFTLCDAYHCSILGPTHPNRLMANSGTIDPSGKQGGPVTDTNATPDFVWNCSWTTVQELLEDAGVSWKVYSPSNAGVSGKYAALAQYPTWSPALYDPIANPEVMGATDHVLPYFTAFRNPLSPLYQRAFTPTFPNDFVADVKSGSLPSVSWMIPPLGFDEHPSSAPANGMWFTSLVLDALTSNANVWSKTAFFLMYDENDGWFDHTSQLKLVSERFGVDVPNVSAWRQATVGDLTSTMFQSPANTAVPSLPATSVVMPLTGTCSEFSQDTETGGAAPTVPTKQTMPTQGGGTQPAGDYYAGAGEQGSGVADGHRTTIGTAGSSLTTTKSAYNQLAKR